MSDRVASTPEQQQHGRVSRRAAICTAAGACAGVTVLGVTVSACGSGGSDDPGDSESSQTSSAQGAVLAKVADVPVGGGKLVTASSGLRVMLTQPSQGVIKAFDARCTHQRTIVDPPRNGIMTCPNHGSRFSASDGSVQREPAQAPLDTIAIQVMGENIVAL